MCVFRCVVYMICKCQTTLSLVLHSKNTHTQYDDVNVLPPPNSVHTFDVTHLHTLYVEYHTRIWRISIDSRYTRIMRNHTNSEPLYYPQNAPYAMRTRALSAARRRLACLPGRHTMRTCAQTTTLNIQYAGAQARKFVYCVICAPYARAFCV